MNRLHESGLALLCVYMAENPSFTDPSIARLRTELKARLGSSVCKAVLFGSRARGDARDDSDYDVLVVLKEVTDDVRNTLLELAASLLIEDVTVAFLKPLSEGDYAKRSGSMFYRAIERDGKLILGG
jgi:predicted nucleotidyltransferase